MEEIDEWRSLKIIGIYFLCSSVIGILMVEYVFYKTRRIRKVVESRDGKFPGLRRLDLGNWSRCKMYPLAMLIVPPKLILFTICLILLCICCYSVSIGHNFKKGPLTGKRKKCHFCCNNAIGTFMSYMFVCLKHKKKVHSEVSYVEYLGNSKISENGNENEKKKINTSTIVSNHSSWIDNGVLTKHLHCSFAASAEIENFPFVGTITSSTGALYIPRFGSKEDKSKVFDIIKER